MILKSKVFRMLHVTVNCLNNSEQSIDPECEKRIPLTMPMILKKKVVCDYMFK